MSQKDWDKLAAFEKAIRKKYGEEAIQNPKANWNEEKEKQYIAQQRELYSKELKQSAVTEKVDIGGVLVSQKLLNRDSKDPCPVCSKIFFKSTDDVCMTKYECCFDCYVKWVENREERWLKGWRPNENHNNRD